jgi:hypothetical protein
MKEDRRQHGPLVFLLGSSFILHPSSFRRASVIFVVFLVPLGLYLLLLGHFNRQSRPVFVSGTLDFVGILFAASGFLTFGGPAILTSLNESWRSFWLLGDGNAVSRDNLLAQWHFWIFLSALYFVVVVAVSGFVLWRRRAQTSVYNVEPAVLEATLEEVCERYGLSPIRSGNVFVFGPGLEQLPPGASPEGIQAPHTMGGMVQKTPRLDRPASLADEFVGQTAVLEGESFRPLRHVTLRWDPTDSPLRTVLEEELERRLAASGAPYHETAIWLTMAGYLVLGVSLFTTALLVARSVLMH